MGGMKTAGTGGRAAGPHGSFLIRFGAGCFGILNRGTGLIGTALGRIVANGGVFGLNRSLTRGRGFLVPLPGDGLLHIRAHPGFTCFGLRSRSRLGVNAEVGGPKLSSGSGRASTMQARTA